MNLAEIFIRRPVMTTLVSLAFVIFGFAAYRQLPVNDLPNVDYPTTLPQRVLPSAYGRTLTWRKATGPWSA